MATQPTPLRTPEHVVDLDEGTVSPEVVVVGPDGVPVRNVVHG